MFIVFVSNNAFAAQNIVRESFLFQKPRAADHFCLSGFPNKATGKKSECKAIIKIIDNIMLSLGFDRPFLNPIPNQEDATIYRMKARYVAVVSKEHPGEDHRGMAADERLHLLHGI